jgi:L-asparaginase
MIYPVAVFSSSFEQMQTPSATSSAPAAVVVLGTGGTIAGTASRSTDNVGYRAAQVGVEELMRTLPPHRRGVVETEQVAQVDSRNMTHAVWRQLALRLEQVLARPDVCGAVVTHGTDTLEETAYLLHRVLAPAKPVVLTAAMRPATSLQADGPQNLLDAITLARTPGVGGVTVTLGGAVWGGAEVRKVHTYRMDAFSAGDAGPVAWIEEGQVRQLRPWPRGTAAGTALLAPDPAVRPWPEVDIVTSHGGADGRIVDLLAGAGVRGIVVAATGNATIHCDLEAALLRAQARGVALLVTTRVAAGPVLAGEQQPFALASGLSPAQARVELLLELLARADPA